jgi:hypothetical protein
LLESWSSELAGVPPEALSKSVPTECQKFVVSQLTDTAWKFQVKSKFNAGRPAQSFRRLRPQSVQGRSCSPERVTQKLLWMNKAAAAIGIDAAQIKGVLRLPLSALHATLPAFKNPANKHKSVSLTAEQFHSSFGNALSEEGSNQLYEKWAVPSPGRPLFEAATAAFSPHSPDKVDTDNPDRGPLLLTMGGKDHTVPEAITKSTLKYRHSPAKTNLIEFEDRGHSLTIDSGWSEVAEACVAWLDEQGL